MINLFCPLPFYDYQLEQNQYRENCNGYQPQKYICLKDNLIPWQISVPNTVTSIQSVIIYSPGHVYELNVPVNSGKIKVVVSGDKRWIIFTGGQLIFVDDLSAESPLVLFGGTYDIRVKAGNKTYYSEQFYIAGENDLCAKAWNIKISAWNETNWNGFYFDGNFKFYTFFDTFISNILFTTADTNNKDGYDRSVLSQRVVTPGFRIKFDPMPNVLSGCISVLTAMRNFKIEDRLGNVYTVKDIKFTQTPVEDDCLDLVVLEFTIFDNDFIKTNCNS